MDRDLTRDLKTEAIRLGFDRVGVAPAVAPPTYPNFLDWIEAGHAAGMGYLERHSTVRAHPERLLEGAKSVVLASLVYGRPEALSVGPGQGKVARYARGADYHDVLWRQLDALLAWLRSRKPEVRGRSLADTAPLLERDFARLAGIGWVGKNTMLIDRRLGSFTVLGALVVDVELEPDEPVTHGYCGTCTRCLDACPTDAFTGPYDLDARKCISYWTIEHKGPIPDTFADKLDGWVFGCDVCQDVCPWNRKAPPGKAPDLEPRPELTNPDLIAWLDLDPAKLRSITRGTALSRAKRAGLLRNAALILGERGVAYAIPALTRRLDDPDDTVRDAAAWALRRIETDVPPLPPIPGAVAPRADPRNSAPRISR
ncbi:MAG: tRNA epoxyqueuosine(34) reductase QueG [Isosphaeraceae bacterium]